MRAATVKQSSGTIEQLRLHLVFELKPEPAPEDREKAPYQKLESVMGGSFERGATLWDCSVLMDSVVRLLLTSLFLSEENPLSSAEKARRTVFTSVETLHFGSPFEIQLLLGAMTVPGIGA